MRIGTVILASLTLTAGTIHAAKTEDDQARQILDASGVKGGLIVHLGCGDGRLTAALHANDCYLVQGLDEDVAGARQYLQSLGLYGNVTAEAWTGERLPYVDGLVNLVVADRLGEVPMSEVIRVLAPLGVALIDGKKTVKPWPKDIDEWTHWQHDAGKNAVAHDTHVGPPRHVQWVAEPLWDRGHEVISSVGATVTARGRIFSVVDEGQTSIYSLPSKWMLIARDAFNGVTLWKQPLPHWSGPVVLGGFTKGFAPQRLVADGDRVYLPLGEDAVLTSLDAATGATVKTLNEARATTQILCADGLLVVVMRGTSLLLAARADTLEVLWRADCHTQSPALAAGRVYFWADNQVSALDARTGREVWRTPFRVPPAKGKRRPMAVTLMVHDGTAYVAGGARLAALSAATGKLIWERNDAPIAKGELFSAGGLLWRTQGDKIIGHDPAMGDIRKTVDASAVFTPGHHPRCYPAKATERYLITNNRGAEFVSWTSAEQVQNDWVRGSCGYGILPANGLLYAPPNPCFCYPGAKIIGFNALAPAGKNMERAVPSVERLQRGSAYDANHVSRVANHAVDWPTYRHDGQRSGATTCDVPTQLAPRWTADLRGPITPPVECDGRLFVAAKDEHTLHVFSADTGRQLWQFVAGGRIDSPPTVWGELVLFGCADGWVYCLRAGDGELAWRFQAAPSPEQIVAFGQLESPWRVHGSLLLRDGLAYCTAGRSSYLDGGIYLYALDPVAGQVVHQARLNTWTRTREDAQGKPFVPAYHMEGARSDILVSQGGFIYLGQFKFDPQLRRQDAPYVLPDARHKTVAMNLTGQPFVAANETAEDYEAHQREWIERTQKNLVAQLRQGHATFNYGVRRMGRHVFATSGFLDDSWFNRTYWMYAADWPGFYIAHRAAKTGQLLVVGPQKTYAVQAFPSRNLQSPLFTPGNKGYLLFADANDNEPVLDDRTVEVTKGWGFTRTAPPVWFDWVPIRIRGMVLAGQKLYVAGPPDVVDPADPMAAFEGRKGGVLRAYSSTHGEELSEVKLKAPPVFDGVIAAAGRLFLSLADGRVLCLDKP